eukprot:scaffold6018_cov94-Skeletonema_dohrnii-CCMP3373.AAC.6
MMMMMHQMNSSDASYSLVGRKSSSQPNVIRNTADHNGYAVTSQAQRGDEEFVSSFVNSSKIAQRRGREAKPIRRHVFDDMHSHFCNQLVNPTVRINSSLAPPGNNEMWFGDLDFDADAAALGFCLNESDPTLNDHSSSDDVESQTRSRECVQEARGEDHGVEHAKAKHEARQEEINTELEKNMNE